MLGLAFNVISRSKKTKKIIKKYLQDNIEDLWSNTEDRWQSYNYVIPLTWDSINEVWDRYNERLPETWEVLTKNWNAETELWDEI
jgi:hypothetical protein